MDAATFAWLAAGSCLITLFAAIGVRSLRDFSRSELKDICTQHQKPERLGRILLTHDRVALAVESLQIIATAIFVWSATQWILLTSAPESAWYILPSEAALLCLILLAVESWLPWSVVSMWAARILFHTWPLWVFVSYLVAPISWTARFLDTVLHRLAGRERAIPSEETFEEEIRTVVDEGHREGLLKEEAREMIEGIIELSERDVSEVMTPRTDMVYMPLHESLDEAAQFIAGSRHTRIPVYQQNRDNIVGILHAKDLLAALARLTCEQEQSGEIPSLRSILREPYFIPQTKNVNELLREFQQTRTQMAIVLDEYGGVSGLITIEDVLEEIVGEIVDEYDADLVESIKLTRENTAEVLARVHIDEINDALNLELPDDDDFDTIGGFVFSQLGHVPKKGEEVTHGDVRITVLSATARRIEKLRVEKLDPSWEKTA
ncbi:Magnesium and cobalt efflux protein CorC [Planctomycetales bacterium 10988]|nr:Magnesium and cobalt efflux protein CorC [Planctomycetales bacterium 10988]